MSRRTRSTWGRRFRRLFVASLIVLGLFYVWYHMVMTSPLDAAGERVVITIEPGAMYDDAVAVLESNRLTPQAPLGLGGVLFKVRARMRGMRVPVEAGLYRLDRSMSPDAIMAHLAQGADEPLLAANNRFTVTPGQNIFQVDEKLKRMSFSGDVTRYPTDMVSLDIRGLPIPYTQDENAHTTLEGYLFPDTYAVDKNEKDGAVIVQKMVHRFRDVWTDVKIKNAPNYARLMGEFGFRDHDFITLASLVEKEVAVRDEAALVAGVFYNRLRKKMPLQTDPTLVYGPRIWQEKPSPSHRRDSSNRYNTYHIDALPPGPICNPGKVAMEAVLKPAKTDAIFFMAKGDGRHAFSVTLKEHRANIRKYRRR